MQWLRASNDLAERDKFSLGLTQNENCSSWSEKSSIKKKLLRKHKNSLDNHLKTFPQEFFFTWNTETGKPFYRPNRKWNSWRHLAEPHFQTLPAITNKFLNTLEKRRCENSLKLLLEDGSLAIKPLEASGSYKTNEHVPTFQWSRDFPRYGKKVKYAYKPSGQILESYLNPRLHLGFAQLSVEFSKPTLCLDETMVTRKTCYTS